jgi:phage tail-like protein
MSEHIPLDKASSYMDFLPAIYRQGEVDGTANFLGRFLKIFEKILSGIDDNGKAQAREVIGIEQILDKIHDYFDPLFTPSLTGSNQDTADFLTYLANWVALSLDENWLPNPKRRLLKRIVPLYQRRGTREGLTEYLRIFVGDHIAIDDLPQGFVIGTTGQIGVDTFVGGLLPHFFIVTLTFPNITNFGFVGETVSATKAILDLEKPVHTYYALRFKFPGIVVGEISTVSQDTIIGSDFPVFV